MGAHFTDLVVIILAVGIGRRLFPLIPKFLALSPTRRTLLGDAIARAELLKPSKLIVATTTAMQALVSHEVGASASVLTVPDGRGSLATLPWLVQAVGAGEESRVVFMPCDQVVDESAFARSLESAIRFAPRERITNVVTPFVEPVNRFGYARLVRQEDEAIHRVDRFIEKPNDFDLPEITPRDNWYENTGVISGTGGTWNRLFAQLECEFSSAGPAERESYLTGDFDTIFSQNHPEDLAAYIADYVWSDMGDPEEYFRMMAASGLLGPVVFSVHQDQAKHPPFVINSMKDHLVCIDAGIAADIAVIVANGITCIMPRQATNRVEQLLAAVESSKYSAMLSSGGLTSSSAIALEAHP